MAAIEATQRIGVRADARRNRHLRVRSRASAARNFCSRFLSAEPLEMRQLLAVDTALPAAIDHLWAAVDGIPAARVGQESYLRASAFSAFTLDANDLSSLLADAPLEFTGAPGVEIALPSPTGEMENFQVVVSPVMEPALAEKFPEIMTYSGQGVDDTAATVRFDVTPAGFHAQVLSPSGAYYVDPYYHLDDSLYASYFAVDTVPPEFHECGFDEDIDSSDAIAGAMDAAPVIEAPAAADEPAGGASLDSSGTELRTYRTAVAATGEYTTFHGGTVPLGQAAIVTAINRVTGIYESELSIRLQLVANNDQLVYTNSATDPYTNSSPSALLTENQSNIDSVIGSANYDIGHVFSTGGGGLAALGVVGSPGLKARGETGLSSPIGDNFYVDYVAHEMGHQFDANHTFNSVTSNCGGGNRNAGTAYEPGSGSTIMAYAGICGNDDLQPHSDPIFHSASFDEIINFVDNVIPAVGTRTATGNNLPTVNAGGDFTIPAGTPFVLTAAASDADGGDVLTVGWEERDLGPAQTIIAGDNGSSPLFRSWEPTTDPSRTFPRLSDVLDGTPAPGETLPTTTRTMNFRATVRDNRAGGGGVNTDDMVVNVVDTGAPFQVTVPNTAATFAPLSTQTVMWDVAGTTANGIDTALVNILLSPDGGNTFPTVLVSNTANDGSEDVLLPDTSTSTARIKVEGAGNIFFDVSDVNFAIEAAGAETTLLDADFSDEFGDPFDEGFTVDNTGATVAGLWHLSTGRGSDAGHTSDDSFYFGTGEGPAGNGDYDVGDTAGRITSPTVSLAGATSAQLSFSYFLHAEVSASFDRALVQISQDGGAFTTVLSKPTDLSSSGSGFSTVNFDLAAYLGSDIAIRFDFDTIDGVDNAFEGWYVDDVVVTATIPVDNPDISISDVSQAEGDAGTTDFVFTVTLAQLGALTTTVEFTTADGTSGNPAIQPGDYTANSGTLTFLPGITSQLVTVTVIGDTNSEADEDFTVDLSGAVNGVIVDSSGLGTIQNDDADISINDPTPLAEGNTGTVDHVFTVSLANPSALTVTVVFATADGIGFSGATTANSDYVANSGTLTFAPGVTSQLVTVHVNGDMSFESDETFTVNLSGAVNGTIVDSSGSGTILNDDPVIEFPIVTGRHLFYDNSKWDGAGDTSGINSGDTLAIATDKTAYLPGAGSVITPASMSSYSRGLNGIFIELTGTHGTLSLADFGFKMSNQGTGAAGANNTPSTWSTAPAPTSFTVLSDNPTAGTDRVEFIWADLAITNRYLEVRTFGNDAAGGNNTNTGLAATDIFYFGSKPGDTFVGTGATTFLTSGADEIGIQASPIVSAATITSVFDMDRNGAHTGADRIVARTYTITALTRINIASPPAAPATPGGDANGGGSAVASALASEGVTADTASQIGTPIDLPAAPSAPASAPARRFFQQLGEASDPRASIMLDALDTIDEALALDEWLDGPTGRV